MEKQLISAAAGGSTGLANYGFLEMDTELYSNERIPAGEIHNDQSPTPQNSALGTMTSDGTANGTVLSLATGQEYESAYPFSKTDFYWRSAS